VTPPGLSRLAVLQAVSRHRGLLAGGLAAGAVAAALGVLAPSTPPGVVVLRAAHDLSAGTPLSAADVVRAELPPGAAPDGVVRDPAAVLGRLLAAPVRRGEPLTDVRLAGAGLLGSSDDDLLAVPVRLADAATAALLHAGDRVDVLAAATVAGAPAQAQVVVEGAQVLAVPASAADSGDGALVVLAADAQVARRLAAAAVSGRLSVALRPPR
jgi:pilus assembly protein CpaB